MTGSNSSALQKILIDQNETLGFPETGGAKKKKKKPKLSPYKLQLILIFIIINDNAYEKE